MVDTYRLGYTKWDDEQYNIKSRIIVPSYDNKGNLTYWTGRDFTGYDKRQKYLNVQADRKKIIFNEGLIEWDGDIVLVEGIIDSIVYPNCIPLMGKQLYKDSRLYDVLSKKSCGNVYICLDSDTDISETKRIYRLLNKGRMKGRIFYIRMKEYKDFGEVFEKLGKEGLINIIRSAKQFTEFDLIF
jgi:DNA primase